MLSKQEVVRSYKTSVFALSPSVFGETRHETIVLQLLELLELHELQKVERQ